MFTKKQNKQKQFPALSIPISSYPLPFIADGSFDGYHLCHQYAYTTIYWDIDFGALSVAASMIHEDLAHLAPISLCSFHIIMSIFLVGYLIALYTIPIVYFLFCQLWTILCDFPFCSASLFPSTLFYLSLPNQIL